MKFPITIFFVFVFVAIIGAAMHEVVREKTANSIGYESYSFHWGQFWFENDTLWKQIEPVRDANLQAIIAHKPFPDKDKWDAYLKQDTKGKAMIELSAKIFTFSLSFLGLIILFIHRKKRAERFAIIDWVGVVLALFIMKQVFLSSFFILSRTQFCDYAAFGYYFKLPFWGTEYFMAIMGLLISLFVCFKVVPKARRIIFLIAGLMGGLTGIALWFFFVGKLLFR